MYDWNAREKNGKDNIFLPSLLYKKVVLQFNIKKGKKDCLLWSKYGIFFALLILNSSVTFCRFFGLRGTT